MRPPAWAKEDHVSKKKYKRKSFTLMDGSILFWCHGYSCVGSPFVCEFWNGPLGGGVGVTLDSLQQGTEIRGRLP